MTAHMMPFASMNSKCLLHQSFDYLSRMADANAASRLKAAREAANFESAKAAAEAMGVPVASYIQHENGSRGFKRDRAEQYARRFRTTPEWLLLGRGDAPEPSADPSADDLEQMIREAIDGVVTVQTRLSDLPRIVAPALHEQLERFRADRAALGQTDGRPYPGKGARSRGATREAE
jgi:transcriptional regulator with XRE-family HTH domain